MKTAERLEARRLRALGWSLREIERTLRVARSSVSVWVRDVQLTPEQSVQLAAREKAGPRVAGERRAAAARTRRAEYQRLGRERIRAGDADYAAGCALYWAEGSKTRTRVELVNADPELVATFLTFLRRHFDVPNDRVVLRLNLFADHVDRQRAVEAFWLGRLGLDRSSLRTPHVNVYSKYSQKKRTNKLPYGTCTLRVHSGEIVQTIYGSIQELGGFDRPEWLD